MNMRLFSALMLTVACSVARANGDVMQFINEAMNAGRMNYMGTVVYQRGAQTETLRVAKIIDSGVEQERVATLDGVPKEMIRIGDKITTYLPDQKLIRTHPLTERMFPVVPSQQAYSLLTFYSASDLGTERIAGLLARGFAFTPRDSFRYGQQWWAEVKSGLPLRARILNERGEIIEQIYFTDVQIGGRVSKNHVRSVFASKAHDWRAEEVPLSQPVVADSGWKVRELPPGFAKVREAVRSLGKAAPGAQVTHLLFSDGIATISVFIEAAGVAEPVGSIQQGSMNIYRRQANESVITALGQTPTPALKAISDSLVRVGK